MGMIPKSTKAEIKIVAGQSMQWLMGGVITLMLSTSLNQQCVHASFQIPFTICCMGFYVLLQRPAPSNPTRKTWQGLALWLIHLRASKHYSSILGCGYQEKLMRKEKEREKHGK